MPKARIFHHFKDCEEFFPDGGMWQIVTGPAAKVHAQCASDLMADPGAFQAAMEAVLTRWPNSCEQALSSDGNNQRAWLGHAGCWLGVGSPEECTRAGWHMLDDAEQYGANAAADRVIGQWRALNQRGPIRVAVVQPEFEWGDEVA
jgi:hypothetical protein